MRSCDFAIARFQYLRNLMFVHGHYYYRRIATVVFYFFYKVFHCLQFFRESSDCREVFGEPGSIILCSPNP